MKNDFRGATVTGVQIGSNNTINNTVIKTRSRTVKVQYRADQIGGSNEWHGYIHYLVERAAEAQTKSGWEGSPQKMYSCIQRAFGNKTFMLPLEYAPAVARFLMEKIDQTRFARGLGYKFYHSFEEHQQKAKRRITDLGTKE